MARSVRARSTIQPLRSTGILTVAAALSLWRGRTVGIVFQFFQLLPSLTAVENVMLPMDFCDAWPAR